MIAGEEDLARVITETPAAEASFYSLSYVAALLQCTALAYHSTLHAVTCSTGSSGLSGDSLTECITRLRLETERRVAGQLRTALLQGQTAAQARGKDGKAHASIEAAVETAALGETTGDAAGPSPMRRRVSSGAAGGSGANNSLSRPSQRSSRQPSTGTGPRNSLPSVGPTPAPSMVKRGSKETPSVLLPATPMDTTMAVRLLREGLARSFGWPLPSSSLFTEEKQHSDNNSGSNAQLKGLADTFLSRRSFVSAPRTHGTTPTKYISSLTTTPASVPLYMELEDEEGRQDILLEWMEDVLIFAVLQNFNAAQTQCLLLDSVLALKLLETHTQEGGKEEDDGDESDALWEKRMADTLQEVLCTQTCPTTIRVIETTQQRQPVTREVPDPVQVAELEQKRLKATTQKALAALDAVQAAIPLVKQTFMENVKVETERDATLLALFSMAEAAAIVEFITRSIVMHRQLWRLVLRDSSSKPARRPLRPVLATPLCAYVEDVPPVFLPPLSAFYSEKLQGVVDAQRGVYNNCIAEKRNLFTTKFELPLAALSTEEVAEREALLAAARQAVADDRDAALTMQECAHVEKAFHLRLEDTMMHNAQLSSSDGAAAFASTQGKEAATNFPAPTIAASMPATTKRKTKSGSAATSTRVSSAASSTGPQVLSADAAAAIPLPPGTVFTLADVEKRIDRIAVAAENLPNGNTSGAAGRGGQRKR